MRIARWIAGIIIAAIGGMLGYTSGFQGWPEVVGTVALLMVAAGISFGFDMYENFSVGPDGIEFGDDDCDHE